MSTYLKIRWERTDDNSHHEEVWERENDGVLFMAFRSITNLIHITESIHGSSQVKEEIK